MAHGSHLNLLSERMGRLAPTHQQLESRVRHKSIRFSPLTGEQRWVADERVAVTDSTQQLQRTVSLDRSAASAPHADPRRVPGASAACACGTGVPCASATSPNSADALEASCTPSEPPSRWPAGAGPASYADGMLDLDWT
jgi:hypothetical protein